MSMSQKSARVARLLATARSNPAFAAMVAADLPPSAQASLVAELARPAQEAPRAMGPRKCAPQNAPEWGAHSDYSAQLNLFAASTRRVG